MEEFDSFADVLAEVIAQATGDVADSVMVEKAARESLGQLLNSNPQYAGGNGVQLPAPMPNAHPYNVEAGFEPTGADFRDVQGGYPVTNNGGQLAVPPAQYEPGFVFGKDLRGLALRQQEPPSNQNFGVQSDQGALGGIHGDEPNMSLVGTVDRGSGQQFDTPLTSDIIPVFNRLRDKFGATVAPTGVSGLVPGQAMSGIPLGDGSGVLGQPGGFSGAGDGRGQSGGADPNTVPAGNAFQPQTQMPGMPDMQPHAGDNPKATQIGPSTLSQKG